MDVNDCSTEYISTPRNVVTPRRSSPLMLPMAWSLHQSSQLICSLSMQLRIANQRSQLHQKKFEEMQSVPVSVAYLPIPLSLPKECLVVFWDYENCSLNMTQFDTLPHLYHAIETQIDHFLGTKLSNKNTKLYGKFKDIHSKICEDAVELGIHTINVESQYKQETVDKQIIADIGLFAANCAERGDRGYIVLISGDKDYAYVLSQVRKLSCINRIILFHNKQTKFTLKFHCDHSVCMFSGDSYYKPKQKQTCISSNEKNKRYKVVSDSATSDERKRAQWPSIRPIATVTCVVINKPQLQNKKWTRKKTRRNCKTKRGRRKKRRKTN